MVLRESDIDVATVLGFGFPVKTFVYSVATDFFKQAWLGGLMHWARYHAGWPHIVASLDRWRSQFGLPLFTAAEWARKQKQGSEK